MTRRHFAALFSRLMTILVVTGWCVAMTGIPASANPVDQHPSVPVITQAKPGFPTGITFTAEIPLPENTSPDSASLMYRIASDATLNLEIVPNSNFVVEDNKAKVDVFIDLQRSYVPLGVTLTFFWELSEAGTPVLTTLEESTPWIDSRFEWDTHASDQVTFFTYGMDDGFAVWMLEKSQETIDDLESRYRLDAIEPISIWIYKDSSDFAATRQVNSREAIAGLSYPGASLVVAIIPDGNKPEFGRVIPHEISHQVLFHATENPFSLPPLWFDEGLATHYQTGGTSHYPAMVWEATQRDALFDITSLNASFPFQPAQASLAYASSWSIVAFIEQTYGAEGIAALIDSFSQGFSVDDAIEQALGMSASELNADWHQWVTDQGNPGRLRAKTVLALVAPSISSEVPRTPTNVDGMHASIRHRLTARSLLHAE